MKKFTKIQAKELDELLDALYGSNSIRIDVLGKGAGIALNERDKLATQLVEDGYAEVLSQRGTTSLYAITQKGRSFCRVGGYTQPFRDKWRVDVEKWIDRAVGFASGSTITWILTRLF